MALAERRTRSSQITVATKKAARKPMGERAPIRRAREPVGKGKKLCRRLVSHLLQFGGGLRGMLGGRRPLGGGELGLQGFMSRFEGVCLTFRAESANGEATFGRVGVRRLRDRTSRA